MKRRTGLLVMVPMLMFLIGCSGEGGSTPAAPPEITPTVVAQAACPVEVTQALDAADEACRGLGRNQVCYGNASITASLRDANLTFAQRGDIVDLLSLERLSLTPYSGSGGEWGVAVALLQASIPDTLPGQNVTVVLFGDAQLQTSEASASAYTFSGGVGEPACREAPNGMLIRTPENYDQPVSLTINGVEVSLGSTAYMSAQPGGEFQIALLEGSAEVTAQGTTQNLTPNTRTRIPLDAALTAAGPPSPPEPLPQTADAPVLPLQLAAIEATEVVIASNATSVPPTVTAGSTATSAASGSVSASTSIPIDDCDLSADSFLGGQQSQIEDEYRVTCPADCDRDGGPVWGTDIYTSDSSICRAAIHAGVISAEGGSVLFTPLPGQTAYEGSERNGVRSSPWGNWGRSFSVARP
ncbi:MAG: LCCL domain-containing protein [bacterium]|nr:LCCL domain-containing protein [bacterium]